nr:hypothetical protein [Tanacetum cinerariifolium]
MTLVLMAKAFNLNYSTPTNNNQFFLSNPRNRHIAQPGMNMGQDRQMQMVGGDVQNLSVQNVENQNGLIVVPGIVNQNPNRNGNVVAARAEGNENENTSDIDEIEKVNANCILMANLQQASTLDTQTNKAPVYDSDRSAENDSNVRSRVLGVEQEGRTVEQHPGTIEETRAYFESLYNNLKLKLRTSTRSIDFKSLAKEADESLSKHKALELEIERLLRAVVLNYANENAHLKTTYKNLFDSINVTRAETKTIIDALQNKIHDTIYENAKLRAELFYKVSEQKDTTKDNTTKTRRPQPRSNTKNDRVSSASKSSWIKNKEVKVEEHHRNLLLSKNKKHMSSECNNIKLAIRNDKSKVVCATCKQCLITANHDVCVLNYVNGMNSHGKKQKANVSDIENQQKQKPHVKKPKKVGFKERLASPTPSKLRFCLRWSLTGRIFDCKGKIITSSESECQSDCSNGDNAFTSNPQEPKNKQFPNSTSLLDRLSKFIYGASTRVVLSIWPRI